MNKELLQAAKDEAAMEAGYNTFEELLSVDGYLSDNTTLITRAMEIYAEMVAVEFAERLRRNYTNHLTGGGGWRYYGDEPPKYVKTTQELFNQFNTKP